MLQNADEHSEEASALLVQGIQDFSDDEESTSSSSSPLDTEDSDCSDDSISAPPFSPLSVDGNACSDDSNDLNFSDGEDTEVDTELFHEDTISNESVPPHCTTINLDSSNLPLSTWKGFKLVGDNIDRNVRASYQRIGHTTQSLHYFHVYALLDRVDFSGLSDHFPPPSILDPKDLLPSDDDIALLKRDMSFLISR